MMINKPSFLVLSGGVGGAKFADGMYHVLPPDTLWVCVNTGDDFEAFGLSISPDLDTVSYTLAGIANLETGWGLQGDTYQTLEVIKSLGGPTWFRFGDKDLATHLERTRLLRQGFTLSQITSRFCTNWGIHAQVIPMSDQPVHTFVRTISGRFSFQEYFVERNCDPVVEGFDFVGIEKAKPLNEFLSAVENVDFIIFSPSNPFVSLDPILFLPGIRELISKKIVIAISPIVGGKAIKGPLAKMFRELGFEPRASVVAQHYRGLINAFVLDTLDKNEEEEIRQWDIITMVTDTVMKSRLDRARLAGEILDFIRREFSG